MTEPTVVMVYVEDGLEQAAWEELQRQWVHAQLRLTTRRDRYAYADTIRMLWPAPGELVVVEQDVIPPAGSIWALLNCTARWCTHRAWTGHRFHDDTLQLARFSPALRQDLPWLADAALARDQPMDWVRRGLTNLDPNSNEATLRRYGRRACLRPDASGGVLLTEGGRRPSGVDWVTVDSHLSAELRKAGERPHVHEPPPQHLHDYQARPVNRVEE